MTYTKEIKNIIRREMDRYFAAQKIRIMNVEEETETTMWGMQTVRHYIAKVSFTGLNHATGMVEKQTKEVNVAYAPMIDTMIDFDWAA